MARNEVHVVPSGEGWAVDGEERKFETQEQAAEYGRKLAREREAEFVLHGRDGRIREKDSYGNDPRNIPG